MATTIRLTRLGKKKRPFYRLVVLDSRKRRDGAYLANLGYYNPFVEPPEINIRADEVIDWLGKGATVSGTARSLMKREGVLYQFSLVQEGLSAEEISTRMDEWRQRHEQRVERKEGDRVRRLRQIAEAEQQRRDDIAKAKVSEAPAETGGDSAEAAVGADEANKEGAS